MMVSHPEYGIGAITLLEGREEKSRATVRFIQGGQERKFVLAQSPLTPIGGKST
jgi:hypothetical protein